MKKILLACSFILLASFTYGQFTFPSEPEYIYPPANLDVGEASEIACTNIELQDYANLGPQNLFAYSWSNQSRSYLTWRRVDPNNATINDEGVLTLPSYRSIDVGIYKGEFPNAATFVIIAYYDQNPGNPGHFYRIYEFTPTGLIPSSNGQLSTSPTYGRISLDVHRALELGIVWEDNNTNSLRVAYGGFGSGAFAITPPKQINNTANATFPHMAVYCASGMGTGIKVVYYDQANSNIRVISSTFTNILSAGAIVNFATEDVAPPMYSTFDPHTLRIDCPEHYVQDNWSYVYHGYNSAFTQEYIACRVNTNTSFNSYELSNGLFGGGFPLYNILLNPTLTYSSDGNSIYYGWHYGDNNIGNPNTNPGASGWRVVVNLREDGVPFEQNYQCVTDPLLLGVDYLADSHYPPVAFSRKASDIIYNSNDMFVAYPVYAINGDHYIATKLIHWGQGHFRPENNTGIHKHETSETTLRIAPNPFTGNFNISSMAGNKKDQYQATLSDIRGTVLYKKTGNLDEINKSAAPYSEKLPAGIYLLNIDSAHDDQTFKIIKIR